MKKIRTVDAVGLVLCHDITQIIKDKVKDSVFRKGHIIQEEDIEVLLSVGKDHIYVYEHKEGMVHENDAAFRLGEICINKNMSHTDVKEGKIEIIAEEDGFFRVDVDRLNQINELEDIMIATRMGNLPVKKGDRLAGMRVIPLVIEEDKLEAAEKIGNKTPILEILPFRDIDAGIVTTGNEVYYKRIEDTFTPVIVDKLKEYNLKVASHSICNDDTNTIREGILKAKESGAKLIICTGGMSVDPDDLTPLAIRESGAEIVSYGSPVLPGAMFVVAYFEDGTTVLGVPGCAMYMKKTILDIILPYAVAGVKLDKKHIARLGYGGFCLSCKICHYPNCQFGKGV